MKERINSCHLLRCNACSLYVKRRFGGKYHIRLEAWLPATSCCPARLIFDPQEGNDTFLRNVASHRNYTALHPRGLQHL
jgi:hypothetical protein